MVEKEKRAKELMLAELKKEGGRFVTQRIIDRVNIFHLHVFENISLSKIAEEVNRELANGTSRTPPPWPGR